MFLHTSKWEGFGMVLLEAMLAGLPVVATRVSAVPEVVADGETGMLFEAGDVAALSAGLSAPSHKPGLADALGPRRLERARSLFCVARMTERGQPLRRGDGKLTRWSASPCAASRPALRLQPAAVLHEHLVQGPQQPALRGAVAASWRLDRYLVTCSEGASCGASSTGLTAGHRSARNPVLLRLAGRRYQSLSPRTTPRSRTFRDRSSPTSTIRPSRSAR